MSKPLLQRVETIKNAQIVQRTGSIHRESQSHHKPETHVEIRVYWFFFHSSSSLLSHHITTSIYWYPKSFYKSICSDREKNRKKEVKKGKKQSKGNSHIVKFVCVGHHQCGLFLPDKLREKQTAWEQWEKSCPPAPYGWPENEIRKRFAFFLLINHIVVYPSADEGVRKKKMKCILTTQSEMT